MKEVLEYLQMKNQYYEKFYEVTRKFLEKIHQERWQDIDFFIDNRDRILNIIRSLEYKISRSFAEAQTQGEIHQYKNEVKNLLQKRKELGEKIVALDLELISKIDEVKTETISELKKTVTTQNQLNLFSKSSQTTKTNKRTDV